MAVDVVIVGAGHNGLVAGSYLARDGHRVLIVEASPTVGGMTSTNCLLPAAPRHRINEGAMDASLIRTTTIPADLELARFGWREVELDPPYAWLDQDGSSLCVWRDPRRTAEELRRFSTRDARAFLELANQLAAMIALAIPYMNTHPLRPATGGLTRGLAKAMRHPARLLGVSRLFAMSHAEVIEERFEHRSIRAMLAALPCFAPITEDGTGWVLIYFGLIHAAGVGRYITGTGGITDALERCFRHHGGEIRTGAVVEDVLVSGGKAGGVRLACGEELHADAVITACNVKSVLTSMLPDGALDQRLLARARRIPTDGTRAASFKFDLALSGRIELAEYHANRTDSVDLRKPCLCYTTFEEHLARAPARSLAGGQARGRAAGDRSPGRVRAGHPVTRDRTPSDVPTRLRAAVPLAPRQRLPRRSDRDAVRTAAPRGRLLRLPHPDRRARAQRWWDAPQRRDLRRPRQTRRTRSRKAAEQKSAHRRPHQIESRAAASHSMSGQPASQARATSTTSPSAPARRKTRGGRAGRDILQATERLLRDQPLAELSVERICEDAGTTRATFYHYFGSKHGALATLAGELWDGVFAKITPYTQGSESPQHTIRDTFRQAWQIWIDHAPVFRALAENWADDPELTELWTSIINRFTVAIAVEIDRERTIGAAPPGPDSHELAAVLLWSTAHCLHIAGLHTSQHMPNEAALFETIMTVWLRSIYGTANEQ